MIGRLFESGVMAGSEYDKFKQFVNSVHAPGRSFEFLSLGATASEPFGSSLRLFSPAAQKPVAAWGEGRVKGQQERTARIRIDTIKATVNKRGSWMRNIVNHVVKSSR